MHRLSLFGIALPVLALAACSDSSNPGAAVAPVAPEAISGTAARGAQLARDLCASCHGATLAGGTIGVGAELGGTSGLVTCPGLNVVQGYSLDEFDALLSTGLARDGEVVDPMVAQWTSLTVADRLALHEYLRRYLDQ